MDINEISECKLFYIHQLVGVISAVGAGRCQRLSKRQGNLERACQSTLRGSCGSPENKAELQADDITR